MERRSASASSRWSSSTTTPSSPPCAAAPAYSMSLLPALLNKSRTPRSCSPELLANFQSFGFLHDPIWVLMQKELLDPAIKGTMNVLTAAKEAGVRRVVVTSSVSAITPSPNWPGDVPKGENCWTDAEFCKQKGVRKGFHFFHFLFLFLICVGV